MILIDGSKDEKQTANQQLVKENNQLLIFNLIDKHGPISRAELAQRTHLSPTTVSSLVGELLKVKYVGEIGAGTTATSGRKPILVDVNPDGAYTAAFDMLEDYYSCSVYDLKCNEKFAKKVKVSDYKTVGKSMAKTLENALKEPEIAKGRLLGICVGIPALIDIESQTVLSSTVVPIKEGNDFLQQLKLRFAGIPVFLENESGLNAYAENSFGTNDSIRNLVFINVHSGIGAGIILDGRMLNGSFGMAGEIGHMTIDINGPRCKCGNKGCLEVMAGIPAIKQKIISGIMSGDGTFTRDLIGNDTGRIDIDVIRKALDNRDRLVCRVVQENAAILAVGINNIINTINPQCIVLGGEIARLGDRYLDMIKTELGKIALKPNSGNASIKFSLIKADLVTLGGAKLVLDRIFKSNSFTGVLS